MEGLGPTTKKSRCGFKRIPEEVCIKGEAQLWLRQRSFRNFTSRERQRRAKGSEAGFLASVGLGEG